MPNKAITLLFFSVIIGTLLLTTSVVYSKTLLKQKLLLVYDIFNQHGKLRNYRNVKDCRTNSQKFAKINLSGFYELNLSGSGQFSSYDLPYILQQTTGLVFIIDLRQETHGFINGKPVTWYSFRNQANKDKPPQQIEQQENNFFLQLTNNKQVAISNIRKIGNGNFKATTTTIVPITTIATEKTLVEQAKAHYIRFYILDRHKPSNEQVDAFINFLHTLPKNAWLHFHCRAGKGRTTTFMLMYDMLHNATTVALKDLLARHAQAGGSALNIMPCDKNNQWAYNAAVARYNFIQQFYQYAKATDGYLNGTSWSNWQKNSR